MIYNVVRRHLIDCFSTSDKSPDIEENQGSAPTQRNQIEEKTNFFIPIFPSLHVSNGRKQDM